MELEITPKAFYIGDINVGQSVVVAWGVMVVLIALAIAVKIKSKNFTEVPKGLQNLLELGVETIQKYSKTEVGSVWEEIAPYCATIGLYIFGCCMVELIGIRAPTTDLSMTLALGLGTFFWINYMGFRKKGFFGRMKHYVKPIPIIPILTDVAVPISMACRLYGNILAGMIVMELIYGALQYFAIAIPAALSRMICPASSRSSSTVATVLSPSSHSKLSASEAKSMSPLSSLMVSLFLMVPS